MKNLKQFIIYFILTAKIFAMGCIAMKNSATFANVIYLCTKTGQSISIGLSDYTYEEREIIAIKTKKLGFTNTSTYSFEHNS